VDAVIPVRFVGGVRKTSDMTSTDTRVAPPFTAGELDQINGFLDYYRGTIVRKATGLSEEDAHRSLLPSALMTVAGLLSHLRWVEAYWFRTVLDGQPNPAPYSKENPDGEFIVAAELPIDGLIADYEAECVTSREITARLDLTDTGTFHDGKDVNLRWVLLHMIEETARHAGHLDLIRELLDGSTGN
jgi:uncharacterized damage-inducible protein DinB